MLRSAWLEDASFEQDERRAAARHHDGSRQMSAMRKWMVRSLTAMALAVGSLACLAGAAQAIPPEFLQPPTCGSVLGAGNTTDVDAVSVDTGPAGVDFGTSDYFLAYLYGRSAPDFALVCWHQDGRVAVIGRVFADSDTPIYASVGIKFYRSDKQRWYSRPSVGFTGSNRASVRVLEVSGAGKHSVVAITLSRGLGDLATEITTVYRNRGDSPAE